MNEVFCVQILNARQQLICEQQHSLERKLAIAEAKHFLERRSQQLHHKHVEITLATEPLDSGNTGDRAVLVLKNAVETVPRRFNLFCFHQLRCV